MLVALGALILLVIGFAADEDLAAQLFDRVALPVPIDPAPFLAVLLRRHDMVRVASTLSSSSFWMSVIAAYHNHSRLVWVTQW